MNWHFAFLLYPGAILLFLCQKFLGRNIEFNEFKKGKFENYSYFTSVIMYLILFYSLKK